MIRNVVLLNLHSLNALPAAERWYWREHAPQSVRKYGPWMTRYEGFRAAPPGAHPERFGYYNYRMADVWFRDLEPMPGSGDWIWFPGQDAALGVANPTERFGTRWTGSPRGPRPPLLTYIPGLPTEDFLGADIAGDARTRLRWLCVFAYPKGVSLEQGDEWFLNTHVPQALRQPGLYRYFSYRTVQFSQDLLNVMSPQHPFPYQWSRVVEMWYEDYDAWTASVIDSPPDYTPPPWATAENYPFFEPYSQFVSTFLLERPDWTKEEMRPYP